LQALAMYPDGPAVVADIRAGCKKNKKATELLKLWPSTVCENEGRTRSFYINQEKRCRLLNKEQPMRRIYKKMKPSQVYLIRERFIVNVLRERLGPVKEKWKTEIDHLDNLLSEQQAYKAEVASELGELEDNEEKTVRKNHAKTEAASKALAARVRKLWQQLEQVREENPGCIADDVPRSKALEEVTKGSVPVAPKGRAAPKLASRLPPSRKSKTAVLGKFATKSRQPRERSPASPEPERSADAAGSNSSPQDAKASKAKNSPMAMSPTPAANKEGSPSGSPVARSPPPSPSVPKASAPFVEFVGAPVGKGSKVASGMWPWPTEMITRSRAKVL